jgi:hypothetical protein
MMTRDAEIALARSGAPDPVSSRATIKVLTSTGYEVAVPGDNGCVCIVMRGFSASIRPELAPPVLYDATHRAPICFDAVASRTILPLEELRARLGMQGKGPEEISREVGLAYALGTLPRHEGVAFAYMWSADQRLGTAAAWHPHMMVYTPYYKNAMLGGNEPGGVLPFVDENEGTPFAVTIIRVDDKLAVRAPGAATPAAAAKDGPAHHH